jgi:hypothetical protein
MRIPTRKKDARSALIKDDLVDRMVTFPGQLFHAMPISVGLWSLTTGNKTTVAQGQY